MSDAVAPQSSEDQVRRLKRLLDAAMLLNSTLALKDLTEIILDLVRADVPVERVTAFRVDHKRKVVHSLVAQETDEEISLPIGSGIAGTVAATGVELDIPDAYSDPRFNSAFDRILKFHTKDLLALPIVNRVGEVVGVLELVNRLRPIDESDIGFLRGISVYVGLALENAWLYREALAKQKVEEELIQVRDRLAQMERVTTVAHALSGVVHEINNPLTIAMGNVGLLKSDLPGSDQHLNHVLAVETAIDRTATAVRRFAQLTTVPAEEQSATDLNKLLGQVIELRRLEWGRLGISAAIDLQPTPPLYAHEGELQLAFLHLLNNAEEAAVRNPVDSRISVRTFYDVLRRESRIEIEDSGPGITEAAGKKVFTPFYTTKPGGSAAGLGLTTVRSVVERHKGRVWFETTQGQGTTFIVELPDPADGYPRWKDTRPVLVSTDTLRMAAAQIGSCEACTPDEAEIPFDYILDSITGCDPEVTDYVLAKPVLCPRCSAPVKTGYWRWSTSADGGRVAFILSGTLITLKRSDSPKGDV